MIKKRQMNIAIIGLGILVAICTNIYYQIKKFSQKTIVFPTLFLFQLKTRIEKKKITSTKEMA